MLSALHNESALVTALKHRDNTAFESLYHNYKGALLTVVRQFITDNDIAEDVLQEAFVTIWKNIDKFDNSKGKLFTWMYNIARNSAINTLRSKTYKSEQKNDSIDKYVSYTDNIPEAAFNTSTIGLKQFVSLLREDYKNVIELAYFKGNTHEEISTILDVPLGTVKTRLRNALIELRKYFNE